jgi:prophage antirepressor-like protein
MVGWAGQPSGWPVSFDAGSANLVQFTTREICTSGGDYPSRRRITMNTKPIIFNFESDAAIHAVMVDDNPWFFAIDVCQAIGIANHRDAVRKLDDDEKGVGLTDTLGGEQEATIISESGLYTLILRCRDAMKPGTVPYRFRKWVTGEVLPKIRHTGKYSVARPEVLADLVGTGRPALPAPQEIPPGMLSAIMEAIKSQTHRYSYPKKPGFMDHFHTPTGVRLLTKQSQLMDLLRELEENGNDVGAPAAELVCLINYVADVDRVMQDIATHAAYITNQTQG